MVGARLPERVVPLHSFIADQDILHGIVQRMSHMQLSRNIRRRDNDGKRFLRLVHLGVEIILVHPLLIQSVLQPLRVVGLCQFLAHVVPSCINPSLFFTLFLILHCSYFFFVLTSSQFSVAFSPGAVRSLLFVIWKIHRNFPYKKPSADPVTAKGASCAVPPWFLTHRFSS